ncbi:MAG: septation protein SpoVG family protein [Candidatus Pacebacteria bacterium]|nr:septation protein SpoVG family protein [Candidatus Paceibacterota bacterium]
MKDITISEIQIIPVKPQNGLVAFASAVINDQIYIGNLAIYTSLASKNEYRLVYPSKILPTGKQVQCIHPITKKAGKSIQAAIIKKYQLLMKKCNDNN